MALASAPLAPACFASHLDSDRAPEDSARSRVPGGRASVLPGARRRTQTGATAPDLRPRPRVDEPVAARPLGPDAPPEDADEDDDAGSSQVPTWSCAPTAPVLEPTAPTRFARNVIFVMGDGMGAEHYAAARAVKGEALAVDALQGPALYGTDAFGGASPTDSAAAATAMATGRCTRNGLISVDPEGRPMPSVVELAHREHKRVGLITNTVLADASPMAFATHARDRYCFEEMVAQLFSVTRPALVLGGFVDGAQLAGPGVDEQAADAGYTVAFDMAGLTAAAADAPLLGMLGRGPSHPEWPDWQWGLTPEHLRPENGAQDGAEPTLAELTAFALRRLSAHPDGFFLFVENEHTDTVGHLGGSDPAFAAELMPYLVLELDAAVAEVLAWVEEHSSFEQTLVVVGSDHETGGYTFDRADPSLARFEAGSSHTATPVPLYAAGPGSERVEDVRHLTDIFLLLTGRIDELPRDGECPP